MSILGASAGLLVEQYDITSDLTEVSVASDRDSLDATTLGSTGHRFQMGLEDGGFQISAHYNDAAGGISTLLKSIFTATTPKIATSHSKGRTIGYPAELCYADSAGFDGPLRYGDLASVSGYLRASEDGVDFGVWLHALTAETANANSASVDNGAATSNGGVGHLHITATAGTISGGILRVQHSADNLAWADLAVFGHAADDGVGASRVEVAAGTTVNRYTRAVLASFSGSGGPSVTYAIAFARR